eukprot:TRINITY_DN38723_c0_g1_i1.p1 TRINITY_DN38723_c0_g1~~TRINITY_DN38723_c0_g1_i1.p1  ORF type:complete len:146 (+),score=19.99 TRINITY_DN38723_c0_g1_i1:62-499(+)
MASRTRQSWLLSVALLLASAATVFHSFCFVVPTYQLRSPKALTTISDRTSVALHAAASAAASEEEEQEVTINFKKRAKKRRGPKFDGIPKFIVGGLVVGVLAGYIGGGWILAGVWGIFGAGVGVLFEPTPMPDGSVSGFYREEDY